MTTFDEFSAQLQADIDNSNSAPEDNGTPAEQVTEVSADGATHESDATQPDDRFDLDAFGDKLVPIKVQGEEQQVPLRELRDGYMRQADYTRKTQEAAEAQRLWEAFQADPQTTLEILSRQFSGSADPAPQDASTAEDDGVDPEFAAIRDEVAFLRQREADREMASTMSRLQARYGPDFDPKEVAAQALQRGTADVEAVFLQMQGAKALAQRSALHDDAARRQAEDQQARQAQATLAATSTATPSAAGAGDAPAEFADLEDAVRAALQVSR